MHSYSHTSYDLTREIEEEKLGFEDAIYKCFETSCWLDPTINIKVFKKLLNNMDFKMVSENRQKNISKKYQKHEIARIL